MKLLAIDTSTEACSAALLLDDQVLEEFALAPRQHTHLILPMVDRLLAAADLTLQQLDGLAFGRGPGAFTGLRIAAGVTQGLAFGADLPVVPVSSLAALAHGVWRLHGARRVLTALDARMQEVYWGAWQIEGMGQVHAVEAEQVCPPAQTPLPAQSGWFAAGHGWSAYASVLSARFASLLDGQDPTLLPRAHDVALIGAQLARQGGLRSATEAQPVYLRDRVAEKSKLA